MRNGAMKKTSNILAVIITAAFICSIVFGGSAVKALAATATSAVEAYETQNVTEDLKDMTISGKPFDLSDYPSDVNAVPQLISFVEFAYDGADNRDYGLYFYLYNPKGINIQWLSPTQNKIQIAFGTSESADYEKYRITALDATDGGLIIKYRVELSGEQKQAALNALNKDKRVYKVSGVELLSLGSYSAREYIVGATFTYTGFAKGYGTIDESTLQCRSEGLETVSLDVEHTYYRTKTSNLGTNYQVQLDTVYFSVPKKLIEEYGNLQRIKAEWYEYETKPMLITNRKDVANRLEPYLGQHIGEQYDEGAYYGFATTDITANQSEFDVNTWLYNYCVYKNKVISKNEFYTVYDGGYSLFNCPNIDTLYYLFYADVDKITEYDPYGDLTKQGGVKSNRVYDYIKEYSAKHNNGTKLPIKDKRISADLFEDDISESRKIDNERGKIQKGYSYYDFDIDEDWQTMSTYQPGNHSFTENVNMYGFWNALCHKYDDVERWRDLPPIQILNDSDLIDTSDEAKKSISNRLCINYNDVDDLQDYYAKATKNDENVVVLFRFATTDYYSSIADITQNKMPTHAADNAIDGCAYVAKGTCFFDFDIIQLSFKKGEELHVIPVVMSPQDYIVEVTPPAYIPQKPGISIKIPSITKKSAGLPIWTWILIAFIALAAVVAVIVLIIYFPGVFVTVLKAVGRWISSLFNQLSDWRVERKNRKKRERQERIARKSQMKMQRYQSNLNRKEIKYQNKLNEKERQKAMKKVQKQKARKRRKTAKKKGKKK